MREAPWSARILPRFGFAPEARPAPPVDKARKDPRNPKRPSVALSPRNSRKPLQILENRAILYSLVKCLDNDLDAVFAALGDPVRRRMAEQLAAGEMSLTQLAEPFDMTMPAVMKHLGVLERSGVVLTEKRGRVRYCRLEPKRLEDAEAWCRETARFWSTRLTSLDKYLQENP